MEGATRTMNASHPNAASHSTPPSVPSQPQHVPVAFPHAGSQGGFATYLDRLSKGHAVSASQDMEDLLSYRQSQQQAVELQKKVTFLIREAERRRTLIVQRNTPLIAKLATKAATATSLPAEDLFQYGIIGLLEGLEKYEPTATGKKGTAVKVMSYCHYFIDKRIKEHAEKNRPAISVPDEIRRLQTKIHKTRPVVAKSLGLPSDEVSVEQIILHLAERKDYNINKYWPELIGSSPDPTVLTRLVSGLLAAYTPAASLHISSDEAEEMERQLSDDGIAVADVIELMDKNLALRDTPDALGGLIETLADPSLNADAVAHARTALNTLGGAARRLITAAYSNGAMDYEAERFLLACEALCVHPIVARRISESGLAQLYAAAGYKAEGKSPDLFSGL